MLAEKKVD